MDTLKLGLNLWATISNSKVDVSWIRLLHFSSSVAQKSCSCLGFPSQRNFLYTKYDALNLLLWRNSANFFLNYWNLPSDSPNIKTKKNCNYHYTKCWYLQWLMQKMWTFIHFLYRHIQRPLKNLKWRVFLKIINNFFKTLDLRCLTAFWTHLCIILFFYENNFRRTKALILAKKQ